MIRVSSGTASVAGLIDTRIDDAPTTAYLMVGERCAHKCAFCPQARGASSPASMLSRVTWPLFDTAEVVAALVRSSEKGLFGRVCIQVVQNPGSLNDVLRIISSIKEGCASAGCQAPPVSVSAHCRQASDVGRLFEAGAERIGMPLDAATPAIYLEVKGGSWDSAVRRVIQASEAYPGRISTHFISGLGETEREMTMAIQMMRDNGVTTGLFALTPVKGTRLAGSVPPEIGSYRRIQVARLLISRGLTIASEMSFEGGKICGYGLPMDELALHLQDGEAFMTSGCKACNRPYYNERPGGVMFNYPRKLDPAEILEAMRQAGIPTGPAVDEADGRAMVG